MRRFLLSCILLFLLSSTKAQVIFNEFYVQPDTVAGNHEFFELYNTSTTETINLDCYSLIVLYSGKIGGKDYKGFYVLDFPEVFIKPLGYLVGAGASPDFKYQKSNNGPILSSKSEFSWNSLGGTSGSLTEYRVETTNPAKTTWDVTSAPVSAQTNNFLFGNRESEAKVKYAFFLFNNGTYVNGFMGGFGTATVPVDVTSMPDLDLTTKCGGGSSTKKIDWSEDVKSGEFVIETSGSDNGFIRKYDGKCGEWDKSSNPNPSKPFEHTPNATNGAADGVEETNALSVTTERTVCGTRIDYSVLGIINSTRYNTSNVFPVTVQLYLDVDKDGLLEAMDPLLRTDVIESSEALMYFSFIDYPTLDPTDDPSATTPLKSYESYIVTFVTALGCLDKIVAPPTATITPIANKYCDGSLTFSIDYANYDAKYGGAMSFQVRAFNDANNNNILDAGEELKDTRAYIDANNNNTMDPGEEFKDAKTTLTDFDQNGTFYVDPALTRVKLEFLSTKTDENCVSSIVTPKYSATVINSLQQYCAGDEVMPRILSFDVTSVQGYTGSSNTIYVDLYSDKGTPDVLDANDLKIQMGQQLVDDGAPGTFKEISISVAGPVLIVFRTEAGCQVSKTFPACASLPVNLGSFTAVRNKQNVLLKWETISEQNNRGFYLQRNTKGVWENRAFIFSAASGGNSNVPLTYSFIDANSEKGISQYRIQQVDLNDRAAYSPIRSVRGEGQIMRNIIYPNPSDNGKINVVFEDQGARNVSVSDISGRVIRQYRSVWNSLFIENLDAGMYTIQITDLSTSETSVEKVIIKKR